MMHIKSTHGSQPCKKWMRDECDREHCWFSHEGSKQPEHDQQGLNQPSSFHNPQEEWPNLKQQNLDLSQRILTLIPMMMKTMMPLILETDANHENSNKAFSNQINM